MIVNNQRGSFTLRVRFAFFPARARPQQKEKNPESRVASGFLIF